MTTSLSHAELILLSLLSDDEAHAYDLVRRVRALQVERWARVAESTLYSVLRRMEKRGWVTGRTEPGERRKTRTVYRRTPQGRERLNDLVKQGLRSPEPIHSDRLVTAVVASSLGRPALLEESLEELRQLREALAQASTRPELSEQGAIVIRFQERIVEAHREALESLLGAIEGR